jgi:hypothetical protein
MPGPTWTMTLLFMLPRNWHLLAVTQAVEFLPRKCEALSSTSSTTNRKKFFQIAGMTDTCDQAQLLLAEKGVSLSFAGLAFPLSAS